MNHLCLRLSGDMSWCGERAELTNAADLVDCATCLEYALAGWALRCAVAGARLRELLDMRAECERYLTEGG